MCNPFSPNTLPVAPNREQVESEKRWRDEIDKLPPNTCPTYRCPYCGGIMTAPSTWHSIVPAPSTCNKCGYQYTSPQQNYHFKL